MISADLKGKRALVTGAASGIGLATAELFARSGASVAINDLPRNPNLETEVQRLRGEGLDVIAAPGDAGDPEDAARMVRTACETLGGLDYLVNNAGTAGTRTPIPAHDFESQTESLWTKVFSVNLLGPFRCTVAAAPYLRDGGGAVVNTASVAAFLGSGSSSVYAASKAALINLTREHARAFGPEVRVNSISPGVVVSNWECQFERTPEFMAAIPLQRAGIPEDFAEAILFLCAGGAYITGENLIVDGGLMAGSRSAP